MLFYRWWNLIWLLLLLVSPAHSETIVRMYIQEGVNSAVPLHLKLFDTEKPATVSNFLRYVYDGSYDNSIIHRSIDGFIVQGGGYALKPDDSIFNSSVTPIASKGAIVNEPGIQNLRATIAMARPVGQVDGATSEWFVNLSDNNSVLLDPPDGGVDAYTVFGEVIGADMTLVDSIAAWPTYDLGGVFSNLPLASYQPDEPVTIDNLIKITAMDAVFSISPDHDFGVVASKSNLQPEFSIKNIGSASLHIGDFAASDELGLPFILRGNECENTVLSPDETCVFTVVFNSEDASIHTENFDIHFPDMGLSYVFSVTGSGATQVQEPDISQVSPPAISASGLPGFVSNGFRSSDFGDFDLSSTAELVYNVGLSFQNRGAVPLSISLIELLTQQEQEFDLKGTCMELSVLDVSAFCTLYLEFVPQSIGMKEAVINIHSNDPDEPVFDYSFKALVIAEDDGVDAGVENAAPNDGDANRDGIADSEQGNVASLPALNDRYITLVASFGTRFSNVRISDPQQYQPLPSVSVSDYGVLEFDIEDVGLQEQVSVGLILPADFDMKNLYVYSPDAETGVSTWRELLQDNMGGSTAADIIYAESGTYVTLRLQNMVPGDSSLQADSVLRISLAFGDPVARSDAGGGLHAFWPCIMLILLVAARYRLGAASKPR